jgi:hypothetical protein
MAYSKTISNAYVRRPVALANVTLVFLRELSLTPTSLLSLAPPLKDSVGACRPRRRHPRLPLSPTDVPAAPRTRNNTGSE